MIKGYDSMNRMKFISVLTSVSVSAAVSCSMFAPNITVYADTSISAYDSADISESTDFPEGEGISFVEETHEDDVLLADEEIGALTDTSETVYIETVDDLNKLKTDMLTQTHYTSGKTYVLKNDIDLGGQEWSPLGYTSSYTSGGSTEDLLQYAFNGLFDGGGHTISNFKMTDNQYTYMGFFGVVAGGTVKNLTIENASINYSYDPSSGSYGTSHYPEYDSLLVGFSNYATISNCNVSGTIKINCKTSYSSGRYISMGMISGSGIAKIDNCFASGTITAENLINTYCGGIIGNTGTTNTSFIGSITDTSSSVVINADCASSLYAGGIIARSSTSIEKIENCDYTGSYITAKNDRKTGGSSGSIPVYAGGISGFCYSPITDCDTGSATITADSESSPTAGGIVGRVVHKVKNCTSDAAINVILENDSNASSPSAGGIAGICGSSYSSLDSIAPIDEESIPGIINCTATSKASINLSSTGSSFAVIGGIAGALHAPAEIYNCVSNVKGILAKSTLSGEYIGGICGYLNGGSVKYSTSSGSISSDSQAFSSLYAGGIAGSARMKKFLTYDDSYGVISDDFVATRVYGAYISGCSSDMTVTGRTSNNKYFGGIAGYLSGLYSEDILHVDSDRDPLIDTSSFTGAMKISDTGTYYAGGIAGWVLDAEISDAYFAGTIECDTNDSADTSERFMGGAAGQVTQNHHEITESLANISRTYAAGTLSVQEETAEAKADAFAANVEKSSESGVEPTFTSCKCLSDTPSEINGVTALDADSFKDTASFADWDFEHTWLMSEERPILSFEVSGLYMPTEYDKDTSVITSLMISRPEEDSYVFAVKKDSDGRVTDAKAYRLSDELYQTSAFTTIECDIEGADCELYYWSTKKEPIADKTTVSAYLENF